jgi:hypothetical protein
MRYRSNVAIRLNGLIKNTRHLFAETHISWGSGADFVGSR